MKFIKKHKVLSLLFIISIILMIKSSSIPYFFDPPVYIAFIFDAPKNELSSGIMQLIDIFASAYVTSLVFYILVDYIPAVKQEKKAKEIIAPKLVSLYLYISGILSELEFSAKEKDLLDETNPDKMDDLRITNEIVKCKQTNFTNEVSSGTHFYTYNLLEGCHLWRNNILNTCRDISSVTSFSYCDSELIHIISQIQLSELLSKLPAPDDILRKISEEFFNNTSYMGLGKSFFDLKELQSKLGKFVEQRFSYKLTEISQEEIARAERENLETLKQYPDIANLLLGLEVEKTKKNQH